MEKREVLDSVELGSDVAELDKNLQEHFIHTRTFLDFVSGKFDVLLGQKGSGKSAILKLVSENQSRFPQLEGITIIQASNQKHLGNPIFRHVFEEFQAKQIDLTKYQPQLIDAWKVYVLSVLWNHVGDDVKASVSLRKVWRSMALEHPGLFEQMKYAFLRVLYPRAVETKLALDGSFTGRMELPEEPPSNPAFLPFTDLFLSINQALLKHNQRVWILLDRLDEAFPGSEELEVAGIRSILSAYKDLANLSNLSLKVCLRDDLLAKATARGFRAITHIRPRMSPTIRWEEKDLRALVVRRFTANKSIQQFFHIRDEEIQSDEDKKRFFDRLCPAQVETGRVATWTWVMNRIRDGQGVRTPRDAVSFFNHLKAAQMHQWERENDRSTREPFFEQTVFKTALEQLSEIKLNDHLLAENEHLEEAVNAFREQESRHSPASLAKLLGPDWKAIAENLERVGFIEHFHSSGNWAVPFLYRPALKMGTGSADDEDQLVPAWA